MDFVDGGAGKISDYWYSWEISSQSLLIQAMTCTEPGLTILAWNPSCNDVTRYVACCWLKVSLPSICLSIAFGENPTNYTYSWHLQFSVKIYIGLGSSGPMFWEGEGILVYDCNTSHLSNIKTLTSNRLVADPSQMTLIRVFRSISGVKLTYCFSKASWAA